MSAQLIAALRRRADALDRMATEPVPVYDERSDPPSSAALVQDVRRTLAAEFRTLADEAEGATP
jgi:hypothetical protein